MERTAGKSTMIRLVPALICALALVLLPGAANASGQSVAKDDYCDFLVISAASIHSGPGTQHPVVGGLSRGQTVVAMLRPIRGFQLLSAGGYVAKTHLRLVGEPSRCGE